MKKKTWGVIASILLLGIGIELNARRGGGLRGRGFGGGRARGSGMRVGGFRGGTRTGGFRGRSGFRGSSGFRGRGVGPRIGRVRRIGRGAVPGIGRRPRIVRGPGPVLRRGAGPRIGRARRIGRGAVPGIGRRPRIIRGPGPVITRGAFGPRLGRLTPQRRVILRGLGRGKFAGRGHGRWFGRGRGYWRRGYGGHGWNWGGYRWGPGWWWRRPWFYGNLIGLGALAWPWWLNNHSPYYAQPLYETEPIVVRNYEVVYRDMPQEDVLSNLGSRINATEAKLQEFADAISQQTKVLDEIDQALKGKDPEGALRRAASEVEKEYEAVPVA